VLLLSEAGTGVRGDAQAHERTISPSRSVVTSTAAHDGSASISTTPVVVGPDGFDWGDAVIGALGGMGFALLPGGLAFLALGQRTGTPLAMR
jgi:hypothetical protein